MPVLRSTTAYALGLAATVLTVLFLAFGVGALGIIGDGGPPDLLYVVPTVLALLAAAVVRLRAAAMARVLAMTAGAMLLAGVVAIVTGLHETEGASVPEILGLSAMYAALYAGAAWLFRRAVTPR